MIGQSCPGKGTRFLTQTDIDIFFASNPSCTEILGTIDIAFEFGITDLTPFDKIERIDGALIVRVNEDSHTSTLFKNLKEVGGDFSFVASPTSEDTINDFPLLRTVGGRVNLRNTYPSGDLTSLESIGADLLLTNILTTNFILFPSLKRIGGTLAIGNNSNLIEINGFKNLKYVGGLDLFKNPNCHLISGFDNVDTIGGDFELDNHESLTEFNAFQNTKYLGGKFIIHNEPKLKDFGGFSSLIRIEDELTIENNTNLETISAFDNLKHTGHFLFTSNPLFRELNSFKNLNEISGNLDIIRNEELQSISGFSNLLTIDETLRILFNFKLNSIQGLSNIESIENRQNRLPGVSITGNSELSECAIQSICRHVTTPGTTTILESNGPGCTILEELDCGNRGILGTVFFDVNNNGIKDEKEFGISEQQVIRSEDGLISLTDQDGVYFFYREDEEPNTVAWVEDENWILTSDSMKYTINQPFSAVKTEDYLFSLRPTNSIDSGEVVISSGVMRCNTIVNFNMRYKNQGTEIINGYIELTYPDTLTRVDTSDINPVVAEGNILQWRVEDLFPHEYKDISMRIEMPTEESTGEIIKFHARFFSENPDTTKLLSKFTLWDVVRCSYDPNDKLINPIGVGESNIIDPNTELVYTIRFQNTGNAEAIDISIKDTISKNLDMETFRVINSSFPVNTFLKENIVQFDFNNIWLPDSTTNEPESHGFVMFSISPKSDLPLGAVVYNSASIFFDANPPIYTNNTIATFDVISSINNINPLSEFTAYPNPTNGLVTLNFHSENSDPIKASIYNSNGQLMFTQNIGVFSGFNEFEIDFNDLDNKLYYIHIIQNDQQATIPLLKQ